MKKNDLISVDELLYELGVEYEELAAQEQGVGWYEDFLKRFKNKLEEQENPNFLRD